MSNSNTTQESLEIMKESGKKLTEESINKSKFISKTPSKKEVEENSLCQKTQIQTSNHGHARKRAKSKSKLKLMCSLAVCKESSTPFFDGPLGNQDIIQLHISRPSDKKKKKSTKDVSEKEDKNKSKEKVLKKMLPRDSSQEHTDSTGIYLHEFLVSTLKKNPRGRKMLLKFEQEILDFINDNNNQFKKFPQMTSYHRMLLHQVAAYFGMDHNIDQTGKAVIIHKTSSTRIPEQRFSEHIKDEKNTEFQQRFILKKDDASMDQDDKQMRVPLQDRRRNKSIEKRKKEYQRVRERIFAQETRQNEYLNNIEGKWEGLSCPSSSLWGSTDRKLKLLESLPWSSSDSDGSVRSMRPIFTKASSFSGISILTQGDSVGSSVGRLSKPGMALGAPEVCNQATSLQSIRGLLPCTAQQEEWQWWWQQQQQEEEWQWWWQQQQQEEEWQWWWQQQQQEEEWQWWQQQQQQQQLFDLLPTQEPPLNNHPISQLEDLSNCFGQMSLSHQGSTEAADPSSVLLQAPLFFPHLQQASFIMASEEQPFPTSNYSITSHAPPTQQVLPPQGYMLSPQEIQVSYYPPGQYLNSNQQYQPLSHLVSCSLQHSQQLPQASQQPDLQPMVSSQQQTVYQGIFGVQQLPNQFLFCNQRSSMGGQMEGLVVQYTPLPFYEVSVGSDSQNVIQSPFQQPMLVPLSQCVQEGLPAGGMPVCYNMIQSTQQNSMSPFVGFLQPPGFEQYQIPSSPSTCSPLQMPQQYSGVLPSEPGVVAMQLNSLMDPSPSRIHPWSSGVTENTTV